MLNEGGAGAAAGAGGSQKKTCPYCHQQLSWHALSRHIRDMHKNKQGFVTCKVCGKMFRNKNSLGCHMWRFHKGEGGGRREQQQQQNSAEQQQQQQQASNA